MNFTVNIKDRPGLSAILTILVNAAFTALFLAITVPLAMRKPIAYASIAVLWLVVTRLVAEYAYDFARKDTEYREVIGSVAQIDWDLKPKITFEDVVVAAFWPIALAFNVITFFVTFFVSFTRKRSSDRSE